MQDGRRRAENIRTTVNLQKLYKFNKNIHLETFRKELKQPVIIINKYETWIMLQVSSQT